MPTTFVKMDQAACSVDHCNQATYSNAATRSLKIVAYVIILVILGYAHWRIRVLECAVSNLSKNADSESRHDKHLYEYGAHKVDGFTLIQKHPVYKFELEHPDGPPPSRLKRSIANDLNDEKKMKTVRENLNIEKKKIKSKEEFESLVDTLAEKIRIMHDDEDIGHFDKHMKEVVQAWFPVFDALLPHETLDGEIIRRERSALPVDDGKNKQQGGKPDDKSSEENSSEEKKTP